MAELPQDRLPDSTISFVRDGYEFISNRCRRYRSDVFQTRLMSRPVICMRGGEAARCSTATGSSVRAQRQPSCARPCSARMACRGWMVRRHHHHHHRNQMFMSLMTPEARLHAWASGSCPPSHGNVEDHGIAVGASGRRHRPTKPRAWQSRRTQWPQPRRHRACAPLHDRTSGRRVGLNTT